MSIPVVSITFIGMMTIRTGTLGSKLEACMLDFSRMVEIQRI